MPYTDETILKLREEEKKKQFNTLETGIYLGGQILEFETQVLMNTFSISLPKIMGIMPIEYAPFRRYLNPWITIRLRADIYCQRGRKRVNKQVIYA